MFTKTRNGLDEDDVPNIVIALLAEDLAVKQHVTEAAEVFASSIVLGELYYGARKSTRFESNVQTVVQF